MAERPPTDFDFDFGATPAGDRDSSSAKRPPPEDAEGANGGKDVPAGRRAVGQGRGRSRRKSGEETGSFDPTVPSEAEVKRRREAAAGGPDRPRPRLVRGGDGEMPSPEAAVKPEAAARPRLADEELLDSAFEEPVRPVAGDAPVKRLPPRPNRPEDAGRRPKPRGAQRSIGGVTLPDVSGVGERLRALRAPERPPQLRRPQRGGSGGPPFGGGRIRLPWGRGDGEGPRKKGRIKKLRLLIILLGLALLALVSTFFGMMMAVSSDLPDLENRTEYKASENSVVYDVTGQKLGTLTNNNNRILVESPTIADTMKQATVAIEDQRFYEHSGVDFRGIARAAFNDILPGGATQGASTITQQFVKNALEAQASRTVFEKFREAALAYHLERRWDKDKILTQYLNTIYYGEGAYGIEAAARTYFAWNHPDCGLDGHPRCASLLLPEESAMLAGIISSPSAFSPRANPQAALARRNLVLDKEVQQGYLSQADAETAKSRPLPSPSEIQTPAEDSLSPYFTTWLRQILVDRYGAGRAFGGGLRIKTTLDLDLQQAAEEAVRGTLGGVAPTSSIVVIDNKTGGIKAMVGGPDYEQRPFNIATNGHRQPGSAFKPFTLVTALEQGVSPDRTFCSRPVSFRVPNSGGKERFVVHNYNDNYEGCVSLLQGTTYSDNSIYAQLGMSLGGKDPQKGLNRIAATAQKMGITTPVSTNPAMILGGLREGVTPLEMAYAYTTLADNGEKTTGSLAAYPGGPVPILEIKNLKGETIQQNKTKHIREIPQNVAEEAKSILATVVSSGTGKRAQIGESQWGKTGTTENNGDAWFCGATDKVTACVWVGHADSTKAMETEFGGLPVDGGTFPAEIWAQVISAYNRIQAEHDAASGNSDSGTSTGSGSTGGYVPPSSSSGAQGSGGGGAGGGNTPAGGGGGGAPRPAPAAPAPSGGGGVGAGL
jgi:penicillin-binding protein 1A